MNIWFLDENGTDIYLKWTDDVRVFFNKKELVKKLNDLETKLAEKDKAHMKAMENALNDFLTLRQELKQEKISFAVEQLELLKQKMANFDLPNNSKLYNNDMFCGGFDSHYIKTKEEIDNQIKQLNEGEV